MLPHTVVFSYWPFYHAFFEVIAGHFAPYRPAPFLGNIPSSLLGSIISVGLLFKSYSKKYDFTLIFPSARVFIF
jgi:hypothetical protein